MVALKLLLAVLSTAALVSLASYMALAYWGRSRILYSTALEVGPSWSARIFLVLAASGLLTCLFQGARSMLFWMPSTWGHVDENGEYQTLATGLALLFASGGLFFIAFIDKATHEKVWLRVLREQLTGFSEILRASLNGRALADLEAKHAKHAAELAGAQGPLPPVYRDADIREYMGPTRERIAALEELVAAIKDQRKRLDSQQSA